MERTKRNTRAVMIGLLLGVGCAPETGRNGEGPGAPAEMLDAQQAPAPSDETPVNQPGFEGENMPATPPTEVCEEVEVLAEREAANLLVVLDRSGSMYSERSDKWTPAVTAIDRAVNDRAQSVAFGLMKFGTGEVCEPGRMDCFEDDPPS